MQTSFEKNYDIFYISELFRFVSKFNGKFKFAHSVIISEKWLPGQDTLHLVLLLRDIPDPLVLPLKDIQAPLDLMDLHLQDILLVLDIMVHL